MTQRNLLLGVILVLVVVVGVLLFSRHSVSASSDGFSDGSGDHETGVAIHAGSARTFRTYCDKTVKGHTCK